MRWQDDPRVLAGGGVAAAAGSRRSAPDEPGGIREPLSRYLRSAARSQLAALAYDATALAVIVARDMGDRSFATSSLTKAEGFAGASGLFRLRPDGLTEHGLAVLEVARRHGAHRSTRRPPGSSTRSPP